MNLTNAQIKTFTELGKAKLEKAKFRQGVIEWAAKLDNEARDDARDMLKTYFDLNPTAFAKITKELKESGKASEKMMRLVDEFMPGKAVGGTIPNSFKEAGITSLRRV